MKRRAISFFTVLALCLSLCPMRALAASVDPTEYPKYYVSKDSTYKTTHVIVDSQWFDTQGYSYTIEGATAVSVQDSARLYLTTGTIKSTGAVGVEVQAGCFLCVQNPGMTVIGATYGVYISPGAEAQLSGGTFIGGDAAIWTANDDYAALLAPGCAYFGEDEKPVPPAGVKGKTTVMVKECADHVYNYIANPDASTTLTHIGTCVFCGTKTDAEPCMFNFDKDGYAACDDKCGHTIKITITPEDSSFVYDGGDKTQCVNAEVILDGDEANPLTGEGVDYNFTVEPSPLTDVGEFTAAVAGVIYEGTTFTKKFSITQARLEISWDTSGELAFDYEVDKADLASKVEEALLSKVTIAVKAGESAGAGQELKNDLKKFLDFYYKECTDTEAEAVSETIDDTGFTEGLPTDAGTYQIRAVFPGQTNYEKAASSNLITLKINKIDPFINDGVPEAVGGLTYSGSALDLVDGGRVWDGAVVLFAAGKQGSVSEDGPEDSAYSESIPTGTDAGTYEVWYKVEESKNFNGVGPEKIADIVIKPWEIEPVVELGSYSYLYNGGEIRPDVTVMEPGTRKVLLDTEYTVEYSNNINVGGPRDEGEDDDSAGTVTDDDEIPTVTVKNKDGGNYKIITKSVYFKITAADQAGLTITNQPGAVSYGDVFTLGTFGGSGNGTVTWKIIDPASSENSDGESETGIAKINIKSGKVTVTGVGTVTVQATKSGTDSDGNHKDATATWTFTAGKRRVTAAVSADSKTYDGTNIAKVTAVVPAQDIVPGDKIEITVTGTFQDQNAGTNKTVTVDTGGARIEIDGKPVNGTENEKYIVSFSGTTVTADIYKASTRITTPPAAATTLVYSVTGEQQTLLSSGASAGFTTDVDSSVSNPPVEYALSKDGTYSPDFQVPKAANAGTYQVWYRVKESTNYFGTTAAMVEVAIGPRTVTNPVITLTPGSYEYDGSEKRPAVTVKESDAASGNIPPSEYTVTYSNNVNAGTNAAVTITDNAGGNYTVNGSKTFEITKATAKFTSPPIAKPNLTYNGTAQALISAGVPDGGTAVYSLNGANGPYSAEIPTGTDCGEYTVHAKVLGDANHKDSDPKIIENVKIDRNTVTNPTVELSSTSFRYDGNEQKPTITVKDDKGNVIPSSEYTVAYEKVTTSAEPESVEKTIDVGTYKIKIKSKEGGNYIFTEETHSFTILAADQTPLEITGKPNVVRYGDTIYLSTTGGSGNGTVTWEIMDGTDKIEAKGNGQFIIKGVGNIKIKATRKSTTDNYADAVDTWEFYADKKPITATVEVDNKPYDREKTATVHITWQNGALVGNDNIIVTGEFDSPNVGTRKVRISVTVDETSKKYEITIPEAVTASISQVQAEWSGRPMGNHDLIYGDGKPLVSEGTASFGTVKYRLGEDGAYSSAVPTTVTANNGEAQKVYYMVEDDTVNGNWKGIPEAYVLVTVNKAEPAIHGPDTVSITKGSTLNDSGLTQQFKATGVDGSPMEGTFAWENGGIEVDEDGQHKLTFTPASEYQINYKTVTIRVEVKAVDPIPEPDPEPTPTEPGAENASMQTTVRDGTASTVVSAAAGNKLVNEAMASGSGNVVIKPEITGDVTKAEVLIPASAVSRIGNETGAALTVSTPIADVTIPNGALDALSNAGGTVSVAAERVEHTVVLALTVNGKDVGDIPGGLTLTVPVKDAGPGTVAVLIYEDGTRETVRKSVAGGGGVRIPLNGSATVEIVDNSKEFTDVSAESWAADAVAFASAHEMFNGTSETMFSPEKAMSRAMLATVLYNLEGQPEQSVTGAFSDINSGSWYAESVSWATENGIAGGYGGGKFGPNDSITREQLAVMLWRYAGSPVVDEQTLKFTDADQASSYAMEALCWAAENGILNGYGNGRINPAGLATRAQAAQMLKNFIENT